VHDDIIVIVAEERWSHHALLCTTSDKHWGKKAWVQA